MCLILFAWQSHPDYPLVVAANRDEFYARQTRPASWWGQSVSILAGRDEEGGGTWLGINRRGRVAILTNVRGSEADHPAPTPTRGRIPLAALQSRLSARRWLREHARHSNGYNGYNLLVADTLPNPGPAHEAQVLYWSNRYPDGSDAPGSADHAGRGNPDHPDHPEPGEVDPDAIAGGVPALAPGIYGMSNAALDTPWPKLTRGIAAFACQIACAVEPAALLRIMANRALARDSELPETGVPLDWERALSAIQVRANGYGTRTTTILTVRRDGMVSFLERSFDPEQPDCHTDRHFEFVADDSPYDAPAVDSSQEGELP